MMKDGSQPQGRIGAKRKQEEELCADAKAADHEKSLRLRACFCKSRMGWKAIATWSPSLKREGSGYLESKQAACWSLLMRLKPRVQPGHHMKLLEKVAEMGAPVKAAGTAVTDLQNGSQPQQPENPVKWVHQMYGMYRDGKEPGELFQLSRQRWQQVAAAMGAQYQHWEADMVDCLVRTHYPFLWTTYQDVRFPIMRADIGRICVLHRYGGLYSDLDCLPNRSCDGS